MKFTTQASGFKIEFDDSANTYTAYDEAGNVVKETKSKDALEKFLTSPENKEKKVTKRVPVFSLQTYAREAIKKGEATSLSSGYGGRIEYWVSWGKSDRSKESGNLYLQTESNYAIVEQIKTREQEEKAIQKAIGELIGSLEKITPQMLES